jgi:hypothetical protein
MKTNLKFLILLLLIVIGFIINNKNKAQTIIITDRIVSIDTVDDSLTMDNVRDYIILLKIKNPNIVLRQAILETGWFKCTNCSLDKNNLFGFRYNHKYIEFNHWKESIHYYANWQYYKGYSYVQNYYDFLKSVGYATSEEYENKLKNIILN